MKRFLILVILGSIGWTVACNPTNAPAPKVASGGTGPQSWIDAPEDASVLPLAAYKIIAHATDLTGIAQMELSVNGSPLTTVPNSNSADLLMKMEQLWTPPRPGTYLLQIRAQSPTGGWGEYASSTVNVGNASVPSPTPPPTATPTRVPTSTPTPPPNLPNVTIRFTVDDNSLTLGECTNLRWAVTNVSQLVLDNAPVDLSGSKRVCPTQVTSYKLQITTLDRQTTERIITISVTPPTRTPTRPPTRVVTVTPVPQVGCNGTPNIGSFSASPTTINAGGSSTLVWGAVTNADAVEIDHGIGGVGAPGSTQVSPNTTTVYTLTARCKGSVATRQVTVNVNAPANTGPTFGTPSFSATQLMYSNSPICSPSRTGRVQVTISASDPNGVSGVTMFFRYSDGSNTTGYSSIPMSLSAGNWTYLLNAPTFPTSPQLNINNGFIQFYFVATDGLGASATSPTYNNNVSLIYCGKP